MDLFPFLLRRCGANIDRRIHSLHMSIQDRELCEDFRLALEAYVPTSDIKAEFPGEGTILGDYGDEVPPFAIVWGDLVKGIAKCTTCGLDTENMPCSKSTFAYIFLLANTLARSRFLKTLADDRNVLYKERKKRLEKLKRRLGKVCRYVRGITHLIQRAKRWFPISHCWVTDTFSGTGEGDFELCSNLYDVVSRGIDLPSLSDAVEKLEKRFPFILSNWTRQHTVHTRVHAEIRIILHLSPLSLDDLSDRPIGVSKRCCFCCTLWIESHNYIFGTQWMTSGSHGTPDANWALPGTACPYAIEADGRSSVDEAVLKAVCVWLESSLGRVFFRRRSISEGHVRSGGDEDEDSGWLQEVVALAAGQTVR